MGIGHDRDQMERLQAAVARAKQRFTVLQRAFNAMEAAHTRGDYAPSPDLQRRIEEFRDAASEVQRLVADGRSGSHAQPSDGRTTDSG